VLCANKYFLLIYLYLLTTYVICVIVLDDCNICRWKIMRLHFLHRWK